ncbi:dihydrofolate reductase family protein [Nocardia huaxiensis]|uniref:Dihydrofolate reductase family protein n=2 Tax=Nocardia huaxiensis TaxID=2755382 RepID=A0A7D6VEY7_9NOCA|nr:dihydrofolate reductase family protein [Nocardia huaxiensis]QLY33791.1 dihydrofolate reductase family protein [Nocardia huaxiensis]
MGKIIHIVHQSLDGYIEGPDGEFDWPVMDSELSIDTNTLAEEADAFLYGRGVWGLMSYFWPRAEQMSEHPHDLAFAPVWRAKPKYVVSRTLRTDEWNSTVIADPAELAEIKRDKTLLLFGGTELASELTRRGLIDEYRVYVHPVLLGGGRTVFTDVKLRAGLRLVESRTYGGQVVLMRHELADGN